jgi:hypothetical protein
MPRSHETSRSLKRSSSEGDAGMREVVEPRWRLIHCVLKSAARCGSIVLCVSLCSCMSVKYDMRKLEQPVTLNGNPFACDRTARPSLKPVDRFAATVSVFQSASSTPGPYQTQTTSRSAGSNEAQAKAFEKIGGDHSLTITDVRLDTESSNINLCLGLASEVSIVATGTVQQVVLPAGVSKESAE